LEWRTLPQLEKGDKHAYGWSEVGVTGKVAVPIEALAFCVKGPIIEEAKRHSDLTLLK
jgi:hypothetical protein